MHVRERGRLAHEDGLGALEGLAMNGLRIGNWGGLGLSAKFPLCRTLHQTCRSFPLLFSPLRRISRPSWPLRSTSAAR